MKFDLFSCLDTGYPFGPNGCPMTRSGRKDQTIAGEEFYLPTKIWERKNNTPFQTKHSFSVGVGMDRKDVACGIGPTCWTKSSYVKKGNEFPFDRPVRMCPVRHLNFTPWKFA